MVDDGDDELTLRELTAMLERHPDLRRLMLRLCQLPPELRQSIAEVAERMIEHEFADPDTP